MANIKITQCPECKKVKFSPFNRWATVDSLPEELQLWVKYELNKLEVKDEYCPSCNIYIKNLLKRYGKHPQLANP